MCWILNLFSEYVRRLQCIVSWHKKNSNNSTVAGNLFDVSKVHVGQQTYGTLRVYNNSDDYGLYIGNYCSIGPQVVFIVASDHPLDRVSTYPFRVMIIKSQRYESISKGDIVIDDDVWIGYNAIILSGVHIGQGAVIAANSIITKDVPPYAVVAGNPAKIIKYRFNEEVINELLKIDYSKLKTEDIVKHIDELSMPITNLSQIEWMPRKHVL